MSTAVALGLIAIALLPLLAALPLLRDPHTCHPSKEEKSPGDAR